jgi:hypothetical protein
MLPHQAQALPSPLPQCPPLEGPPQDRVQDGSTSDPGTLLCSASGALPWVRALPSLTPPPPLRPPRGCYTRDKLSGLFKSVLLPL